jgi:transposase
MKYTSARAGLGPQRNLSKEEFWRGVLRRFAASGQTVRAFCAARHLAEPSFYAWRRALAQRDTVPADSPALPAFVPVQVSDTAGGAMEIVLAGGRCIRLRGPVDRAALAEVMAVLDPGAGA